MLREPEVASTTKTMEAEILRLVNLGDVLGSRPGDPAINSAEALLMASTLAGSKAVCERLDILIETLRLPLEDR